MAEQTEPLGTGPATGTRTVTVLEHFPVRRAIQWALGARLLVFVVVGAYRTFTLSTAQGRLSAGAWRDLVVLGLTETCRRAMLIRPPCTRVTTIFACPVGKPPSDTVPPLLRVWKCSVFLVSVGALVPEP